MAGPFPEVIQRIQTHLNLGEWKIADYLLASLEENNEISDQDDLQIQIIKAQLAIEKRHYPEAEKIIIRLINSIAKWPKSLQLQILHIASQYSLLVKDDRKLDIYVSKFMEIHDNISDVLKERVKPYYADVRSIQGQLSFASQDFQAAMDLFEEVIKIQKKLDRPSQLAIALYHAGRAANNLQLPQRAEIFLEESYRIFKDLDHIEGQMSVATAFITTFELMGDQQSVISFQSIASDLQHKSDILEISNQRDQQITKLQENNNRLLHEIASLTTQLQDRDAENEKLKDRVTFLENKIDDYAEIKDVYRDLKNKITDLESTITHHQETIAEQEQLIQQYKSSTKLEYTSSGKVFQAGSPGKYGDKQSQTSLNDLLATSKLLDTMYYQLKESTKVKIRLLALQLRISPDRCEDAVRQLEEVGAVTVDSWNFSSPEVRINDPSL